MKKSKCFGFSLVELLIVVAVIVILISLISPVLNGARQSALANMSKVQFSQYISAMEEFYQEYGYYPFSDSQQDVVFNLNEGKNRERFEDVLSGLDTTYNLKGIPFLQLSSSELADPANSKSAIVDAFGNSNVSILIDSDHDGWIHVGKFNLMSSIEVISSEDKEFGYPEVKTWP